MARKKMSQKLSKNNQLKKENGKPINVKRINLNGVNIDIVAKSDFAAIIGMSQRKVEDWIAKGIILQPTFKDTKNPVKNWEGKDVPRKYYSYLEAIGLRRILKDRVFAQRKPIPNDLIEEIHASMMYIRNNLKNSDPEVMEYPITFEFGGFTDFRDWMDAAIADGFKNHVSEDGSLDVNEICKSIYKTGDKLINKGGLKDGTE